MEQRVTKARTERERTSIREAAVGYLVALRLSASVALTYLPWEVTEAPDPIVRIMHQPRVTGFDPRELAPLDGGTGVITLPRSRSAPTRSAEFSPN